MAFYGCNVAYPPQPMFHHDPNNFYGSYDPYYYPGPYDPGYGVCYNAPVMPSGVFIDGCYYPPLVTICSPPVKCVSLNCEPFIPTYEEMHDNTVDYDLDPDHPAVRAAEWVLEGVY